MEKQELQSRHKYVYTTAKSKVFALRKRIRAVKGGTSASKTISILQWIIDYCQTKSETKEDEIVTVASESFPHLNLGAIRDFKNIMIDRGYWKDGAWNATKSFYTFETGNIIEFMSVDTYGKAHGPRRDILFLNECQYLSWAIVDQLIIRTRKVVWMDWNPVEDFWFHDQILPYRADEVDYITLNYKDNEALDETTIREIESHQHDKQWWPVYGLGQDGEIQTRIYTGWGILDEIPPEARLKGKGLDFGYTNDPTALIDLYEWNDSYIVDEVLFEKGLFNSDIAKTIGKNTVITVGDSAEPKSIAEIAQYGVNIIASKKGKGSISHGIDSVKSKKIFVTKRSLNVIKEYRNYIYLKDDAGKITNEPRDLFNHSMDAIRYIIAFFTPKREDIQETIETVPHELPGLTQPKAMGPTPTLSTKTRIELLQKKKATANYETETPWQKPGL